VIGGAIKHCLIQKRYEKRKPLEAGSGLSLVGIPIAVVADRTAPTVRSGHPGAITASTEPVVYQVAAAPEASGAEALAVASPAVDAPTLTNLVLAPVVPISTNQPVPPKVNLSPAAAELAKLAGSGVDQAVMLAYVTNSESTFNLSATKSSTSTTLVFPDQW